MVFTGEATAMGTSLELGSEGADWHMSIHRLDGRSDPCFLAYQGKPVTPADVSRFLPQWRDLVWHRIAASMFSNSKSRADGQTYNLVLAARRSSSLTHDDVISAFSAFMETQP